MSKKQSAAMLLTGVVLTTLIAKPFRILHRTLYIGLGVVIGLYAEHFVTYVNSL